MGYLNRTALIVRPKRRYKEWADSVASGDDDPIFDLDEARLTPTVYLAAASPDDGVEDLIDEYAREIFDSQLELWHTDEAAWPVNRSAHVFRDWFDVTVTDLVTDLDPEEPIDDDLEADAEAEEMLDVLRGGPGGSLTCAWCGTVVDPDRPAMTMPLLGKRQPQPETGLAEIEVGGRRMTAVVPGDDTRGGREGISAVVIACRDECADALLDAWEHERGAG